MRKLSLGSLVAAVVVVGVIAVAAGVLTPSGSSIVPAAMAQSIN